MCLLIIHVLVQYLYHYYYYNFYYWKYKRELLVRFKFKGLRFNLQHLFRRYVVALHSILSWRRRGKSLIVKPTATCFFLSDKPTENIPITRSRVL